MIDFCQLGFIGKMFKTLDLPMLVQFLVMFYNDKPGDWLLDDIVETKMCRLEDRVRSIWAVYRPLWGVLGPFLGRVGGGQVVSECAFNSNNKNSNPAKVCHFY